MKKNNWLDKYADGGELNYNDSKVFIPEGMVGMSNNTQGRNWSPAWGGQFKKGGELKSWNPELAKKDDKFIDWYNNNTFEAKEGKPYNSPDSVYDFYSYFKNTPKEELSNPEKHFPDTYKLPNHPTFSNESIYSTPENTGGSWEGETFSPKGKFQFAMGGSIPGSVGFTYARTINPAPSEGKYAKKTMPSAQDGKGLTPEEKVGEQITRAEQFQRDWMNSPMYGGMLKYSDPKNAGEITKLRKENLEGLTYEYFPRLREDRPTAAGDANDSGYIRIFLKGAGMQTTVPHEVSHGTDRFNSGVFKPSVNKVDLTNNIVSGDRLIPDKDVQKMERAKPSLFHSTSKYLDNTNKWINYVTDPTETRARLNTIRQRAKEEGYYDPFTQFVTPEILNKLQQYYYDSNPNENAGYDPMLQLRGIYTDDEIRDMLNTISENKTEPSKNEMPSAENGQEMKFYQEGLDWKPKTISKNGGWLQKFQDGTRISQEEIDRASANRQYIAPSQEVTSDARNLTNSLRNDTNISDFINDVGTSAAVVGTEFRSPTPEEYQQGRGSWGDRGMLLGNAINSGLRNELMGIGAIKGTQYLGEGTERLIKRGVEQAGKYLTKRIPKPSVDYINNLRTELLENGIISQQKTPNLPWKEPIRKGIEPWGYGDDFGSNITGSKFSDVKGAIFGGKNPLYKTEAEWLEQLRQKENAVGKFNLYKGSKLENKLYDYSTIERPALVKEPSLKKAIDIRDVNRVITVDQKPLFPDMQSNRYTTWDMYLGKPQTKHPMYDISDLTTKDKIVYTIKEDFINKPKIESRLNEWADNITSLEKYGKTSMDLNAFSKMTKQGDSWIVPDNDSDMFGTMGGFHWNITPMADGNYKVMANDIWDLQPFKGRPKFSESSNPFDLLRNMEVGKALGIGKPLDVQVGFIFDPKTKKIINTFGLAGAVAGAANIDQQKNGGITKDNNGYWNPDNWGKSVEIDSNQITMQGVNEPLLGISNTGDKKMMLPGKDYKFKGKKVREFPIGKNGLRQEQKSLQNLDNLVNFTNYNTKQPGGWLNKYSS
jgi:hypothetical protein